MGFIGFTTISNLQIGHEYMMHPEHAKQFAHERCKSSTKNEFEQFEQVTRATSSSLGS
jgi:hypothetical protein